MDNVVVGHLCQDPTLHQAKRGDRPVARFTVAVNGWKRIGGEFIPRTPVFHRVVCFGQLAENASNSLARGTEVVAVGEWVDDSYSDGDGQRRVHIALEARAVGAGLRRATVSVHRNARRDADAAIDSIDQEVAGRTVDDPADTEPPVPADRPGPTRGGLELITGDPVPPRGAGRRRETARAG